MLRAWKTSALTLAGGQPITRAISGWLKSPSSASTSAPRWSSGSCAEIGDELAQVGASLDVVRQPVEARLDVIDGRAASRRAASMVRQRLRAIANSHGRSLSARGRDERAVRAHERLLQRVLAVLAVAEHVAAEREQRGVVTVVERLERGRVAVAGARGERLVAQAPDAYR